jgi:hypothetical protein
VGLLRESIANVVASFDILRTVFIPHERTYLQVVLRHLQPELSVHDVDDIEQFTSELEQAHLQEVPQPGKSYVRFSMARQRNSDRHRIFLRISHAQYDGVCFPAVLQALKACYEGEPILPGPSYAKYVSGALGKIDSEHYAYWRRLLEDSTPTEVISRDRTAFKTVPTQVLKQVVPINSLASINITSATIVKAAWSTVLSRVTGKTDIVFGHLISGRNIDNVPGIESIVGPCLNVVPVRVRLESSWSVLHLLQNIQNQQVENMPYESLGSQEIIDKCTNWSAVQRGNGFPTMVQHQSMPQTGSLMINKNTYQVGAIASQEDTTDFSVVTTPIDGQSIEVCLIYAKEASIDKTFAEDMLDSLSKTITSFSEDTSASLPLA